MRINKYLSECGLCSRREADRLVADGRVTVNGETASAGMQVDTADSVCVDGRAVHFKKEKIYLKFYKPRGIVCTSDKGEKQNLTEFLNYPERVTYAGRLDKESEGLLLLTDDGMLIDRLMRGKNRHEKEYEVSVNQRITESFLENMRKGIFLKDLGVKTRPCRIARTGEQSFRIILTQGLNRQIRRMCDSQGYHVLSLKRIRVANLTLDGLRPGEYRKLTETEQKELWEIIEGKA